MNTIDKLTSKKALETLGPIQDKIDAVTVQISTLREELDSPKTWMKNEKYQVLHSQKEQLEVEYREAKDKLLAE